MRNVDFIVFEASRLCRLFGFVILILGVLELLRSLYLFGLKAVTIYLV